MKINRDTAYDPAFFILKRHTSNCWLINRPERDKYIITTSVSGTYLHLPLRTFLMLTAK